MKDEKEINQENLVKVIEAITAVEGKIRIKATKKKILISIS